MKLSNRLDLFKEGIFTTMLKMKQERLAQGLDVYDLSTGTPNIPPCERIRKTLADASNDPSNYIYSLSEINDLQKAVKNWYKNRYHVDIDPKKEVVSVLGSQEGLAHICLALTNPDDIVLVPDPCYPIFKDGALLAGCNPASYDLKKENDYLIDFKSIDEDLAKQAKLIIVSYPNNPTCATANAEFYKELIAWAKKYDVMVVHDNAYSELIYEDIGHSFLEYEGAKDIGIELNSLSKTYGLAGARIGFIIGNETMVAGIRKIMSNISFGTFIPIQKAAVEAISGDQSIVEETRNAYRHRRDLLWEGCQSIGWYFDKPKGSMFVWAKIPDGYMSSEAFMKDLFNKTGIQVIPGSAFGKNGEGYVRMALIQNDDVINKCIQLMKESHIFE